MPWEANSSASGIRKAFKKLFLPAAALELLVNHWSIWRLAGVDDAGFCLWDPKTRLRASVLSENFLQENHVI